MNQQPTRVAILWTGLSGFMDSCVAALEESNASVFFAYQEQKGTNAPYDRTQFERIHHSYVWEKAPDPVRLGQLLAEFAPEVIVVAGWHIGGYRKVLRSFAGKVPRILCMDNQWRGTFKQYLAVVTRKIFIAKLCDAAWVPGERQVTFANRLGFTAARVLQGMYTAEVDRFAPPDGEGRRQRKFLFAGRYVPVKGIATLARAYSLYRQQSPDPWPLECVGSGPLRETLQGVSGIVVHDFIQPHSLPKLFHEASCFISASVFEPWGVVVHEAAVAGLAILSSSEVGASVHLVRDGVNGFLFAPGDADHLARLMLRITSYTDAQLTEMGRASRSLGMQYSPRIWASTLLRRLPDLVPEDAAPSGVATVGREAVHSVTGH